MKKGIVIAGFAGIGKTTLSKKYSNVIDVESSPYRYDYSGVSAKDYEKIKGSKTKKHNPNFPQNYIAAVKEATKKYDIVFVMLDPDVLLDEYEKNGIDYVLCYPDEKTLLENYFQRFVSRGNSEEFAQKTLNWWYECMKKIEGNNHARIVLSGTETLEDFLLQNGYVFVPQKNAE